MSSLTKTDLMDVYDNVVASKETSHIDINSAELPWENS